MILKAMVMLMMRTIMTAADMSNLTILPGLELYLFTKTMFNKLMKKKTLTARLMIKGMIQTLK